jgi:hypothetical protein
MKSSVQPSTRPSRYPGIQLVAVRGTRDHEGDIAVAKLVEAAEGEAHLGQLLPGDPLLRDVR